MGISDFILKNFDKENLIGAVFLDLSKAFDLIGNSVLKSKLYSIGVKGQALIFQNSPICRWYTPFFAGKDVQSIQPILQDDLNVFAEWFEQVAGKFYKNQSNTFWFK